MIAGRLIFARCVVMAALLPLSADEAYYWLWSRHLAAGYFDHPPMIAWLIRAGTRVFGDTPFGVRAAGVVLSLPATWFVWRAAALILKDEDRAALAALFFNLTIMVSAELLAATPDMPSTVTACAFVYCLARVQASGNGKWWLGVGVAAGLGLFSNFPSLSLRAGALGWLLVDRDARKWLASPWPYLGAALALLVWTPALIWQSQHHWETFAFQFGRVGTGHFTLRYLGEFLAGATGHGFAADLCIDGGWRRHPPAQPAIDARAPGLDGAVLFSRTFFARPGARQLALFHLSGAFILV